MYSPNLTNSNLISTQPVMTNWSKIGFLWEDRRLFLLRQIRCGEETASWHVLPLMQPILHFEQVSPPKKITISNPLHYYKERHRGPVLHDSHGITSQSHPPVLVRKAQLRRNTTSTPIATCQRQWFVSYNKEEISVFYHVSIIVIVNPKKNHDAFLIETLMFYSYYCYYCYYCWCYCYQYGCYHYWYHSLFLILVRCFSCSCSYSSWIMTLILKLISMFVVVAVFLIIKPGGCYIDFSLVSI